MLLAPALALPQPALPPVDMMTTAACTDLVQIMDSCVVPKTISSTWDAGSGTGASDKIPAHAGQRIDMPGPSDPSKIKVD